MERFGPKKTEIPPHPRQEPRFSGDLTEEGIRFVFRDTVDFDQRPILIGGDPEKKATVFAIMGQVRFERLNDYVLRPLAMDLRFREATPEGAFRMMTEGGIYAGVKVLTTLDQAVFELVVRNWSSLSRRRGR